jgi:hypothetical protein
MLLFLVLWLEPAAWEIHVLGLGHLVTITEDAIVTGLLLDGCPSLVHVLGLLVSYADHFTYWNTNDEVCIGTCDGYQNGHFLTILDLVMLQITGIQTLLGFVDLQYCLCLSGKLEEGWDMYKDQVSSEVLMKDNSSQCSIFNFFSKYFFF